MWNCKEDPPEHDQETLARLLAYEAEALGVRWAPKVDPKEVPCEASQRH